MAREARQHELELRKLELSLQNQPLNDESGRIFEIGPKIQLTQITTKFDEKHDEISLYLINFERKTELAQIPKKDWAAVLRDSLDQGKYLLGNKTAALFEEVKKNKEIQVFMVNAVETRAQKKLTEENEQDLKMSDETISDNNEENKESPDELDDILPLIQPEISESNLIKLSQRFYKRTNEKC
ncbi:retrovirus-related Pol polyprotein from transposon 412 [Trichonephila inaurata madagascariensis]|uniref:Retrovirus-related Pol polyprotein from transposon 412 n=1 Tax=Trichonephila inaurata madagascariensis TaxID=2747483 RepID=A0A8X6XMD1_9ARAC|nr:retrovirus-related Pol polyprotein from transposon 412 [Trichonephila inaurata madagascariensis]